MNAIKRARKLCAAVEALTVGPDQEHIDTLAQELELEVQYFVLHEKAVKKGWQVPRGEDSIFLRSWVLYWLAREVYEKDPCAGRPIVPHRTGR